MASQASTLIGVVGGIGSFGAILQGVLTSTVSELYGWYSPCLLLSLPVTCLSGLAVLGQCCLNWNEGYTKKDSTTQRAKLT